MRENVAGKVRLQKFLADAGVAARCAAEDLVIEGRVSVNGHFVDSLPAFVDPEHDDVRVDGHRVHVAPKVYYLLNKPKGTAIGGAKASGKKRAADLVEGAEGRLVPVGRLDDETDGVLIMTNDGDLAQRLTHPRYGVEKVFRAEIRGQVKAEDILKIRKGFWFSEGRTPPAWVKVTYSSREMTIVELTMREVLNRQIPRLFARLGYKVKKLTCIRVGKLTTKGMRVGESRPLKPMEVNHLQRLAEKVEAEAEKEGGKPAPARRPAKPKAAGRPASGQKRVARGKSPKRRPARRRGQPR